MKVSVWAAGAAALACVGFCATGPGIVGSALGHGSVTPQAFDTPGLPDLGKEWKATNPFRDGKEKTAAIEIGSHGYLANCAACHGLELEAGPMAPDLRQLPTGAEGDEIYKEKVIHGVHRDGMTKMEAYVPTVTQSGLWAIRSYIESKHQN